MLKIITGPMFAGKTTSLIAHIQALKPGSFLIFKPSLDTRYDKSAYVTHDGLKVPAQIIDTEQPDFVAQLKPGITTVIIDELNFFKADRLVPAIKQLQQKQIHVIGAGLAYDFMRQPFGATLPLMAEADEIESLHARCDGCNQPADHSYRKISNESQFLLGAAESYGACCDNCWLSFQTE